MIPSSIHEKKYSLPFRLILVKALAIFFYILSVVAAHADSQFGSNSSNVSISDNNANWTAFSSIVINGAPSGAVVTGIDVHVEVVHPYVGDLEVVLTDNDANPTVILWDNAGGSQDNINQTWTNLSNYNGQPVNQTWTLWARDLAASDTGYIDYWSITIYYQSPLSDLSVQAVDATNGTYQPGATVVVYNQVTNIGGQTSDSYRITFYASTNTTITTSDYLLGYADRSGLAVGASHTYNTNAVLPSTIPAGSYYIGVLLTVTNDGGSSNNSGYDSTPITVSLPLADLSVQAVDATNGTYQPGATVVVYNQVTNIGGQTSDSYRITFYASTNTTITTSDYLLGYADRSALAVGASHTYNTNAVLPSTIPAGSYYIGVILTVTNDGNSSNDSGYDSTPITVANPGPQRGTGIGVMGDIKNHVDTYLSSNGLYQLEDATRRANNNPHGHNGNMGSSASISTYLWNGSLPGTLMTDSDNNWNDATQAPGVDAHVYAGWTYDYLNSQLGRNGFDDQGNSMVSTVEFNGPINDPPTNCYNNAFWNGSQVVFCTSTSGYRSMAGALDIVAHEWGHAVTDYESNLVYENESGALNESFSDMLGVTIGFAYNDPDWQQGENFNVNGDALRDLSNPPAHTSYCSGQYRSQPDHMDGYIICDNDNGGVHFNSGIPNKMFYLLSDGGTHHGITVTRIGIENAIKIMYRANADDYWTSGTDFINASLGSISAANDLDPSGAWATQVKNAWAAVGVGCAISVGQGALNSQPFIDGYNRNGAASVGCPINTVHRWGNGDTQDFDGGSGGKGALMLRDGTGTAYWVHGAIWSRYEVEGGAQGNLGYPISDEYQWGSNRRSDFEGGYIYWVPSTNQTFVVLNDTTPPTVPSNLTASPASSSQINLAWTASTDSGGSGLAGYKIERCTGSGCTSFAEVATTTATSYSNTSLSASTPYTYRVRAYDNAGNNSSYSNTASATTQAAPDATPPTVTITSPTSNPTYSTSSSPLSIGGTASDNVGVTQVTWANNRGGSGTASGTTSWSVSGITLYSGDNIITVTARDAANNTGTDILTVTYTPPSDTIPDQFTFNDQTGAALNTTVTSNTITVTGINAAASISITGGTYSINGGAYTSASGTVSNGNTVTVRVTSSGSYSTTTSATLTIGGVSDIFSVTTMAAPSDTTPDQFTFTDQTGVALNATVTSNTITVTGINTAASISITGGTYSINGGAYTSASGTVNNGNTVTVRVTSSGSYSTTTSATLTIGGVSDIFSVTTQSAPTDTTPPTLNSFTINGGATYTNSTSDVTLSISASDSSGVSHQRHGHYLQAMEQRLFTYGLRIVLAM